MSRMHETCKEALDHKLEYVKSLAWQGLLSQLRKDIERENNGPMIITMWKHDIVPFTNNIHYKYLILAHRILACKYISTYPVY